jgi:transposase
MTFYSSEPIRSVNQQPLFPNDTSEPRVKNRQFRQVFPIANIKRNHPADQELLLPINVREWFKENDFITLLVTMLDLLDYSKFLDKYRQDGLGGSFYHPKNMIGIILYSISRGEYSSRKIERNCITDIGYWLACGRITPDHTTIYRFKKEFHEEFKDIFNQIAQLYLKLGLARFGVIAIDGSKFGCNASLSANHSVKWIQAQFQKALDESLNMDESDNEKGIPSEVEQNILPEGLTTKKQQIEKLQDALRVLQEEQNIEAEKQQALINERIAEEEVTGKKFRGRKLADPQFTPLPSDKVNVTDPESRIMKGQKGYCQGYNGQILVDENQVVLAANLTNAQSDHGRMEPLVDQFMDLLNFTDINEIPHTVLSDAGYCNYDSIMYEKQDGPNFLFATTKEHNIPESDAYDGTLYQMDEICRRRGEFSPTTPILADIATFVWHSFVDRPKPIKPEGVAKAVMAARVRSTDGRTLYRMRKWMVEPVFGQIKHSRRFSRFTMKGKEPNSGEFALVLICHNLIKFVNLGAMGILKSGIRKTKNSVNKTIDTCFQSCQISLPIEIERNGSKNHCNLTFSS